MMKRTFGCAENDECGMTNDESSVARSRMRFMVGGGMEDSRMGTAESRNRCNGEDELSENHSAVFFGSEGSAVTVVISRRERLRLSH